MKQIALYVHIPFCVSKCSYCDFCSFVPKRDQIERYIGALLTEIKLVGSKTNKKVFSIYIGGGTPSVLPDGALKRIFNCLRKNFKLQPDVSITIEANPNSFSHSKAQEFKECGCNRLSLGLQSADETVLKVLNRKHNYTDLVNAVDYAIQAGIKDISVDVMLGVPKQTLPILRNTLRKVVDLPITHISAYGLIVEPGTKICNQIKSGELTLPSEDLAVKMYDDTVDYLKKCGFKRYEISNFAKTGYESVHNKNYWARGEFLGIGLNAYSFVNGVHYKNTSNFYEYCSQLEEGDLPITETEKETIKTSKEETIMLALRTETGLDINAFNKQFRTDFEKEYAEKIGKLLKEKLIKIENGHLMITNLYISNAVIVEFFD